MGMEMGNQDQFLMFLKVTQEVFIYIPDKKRNEKLILISQLGTYAKVWSQ